MGELGVWWLLESLKHSCEQMLFRLTAPMLVPGVTSILPPCLGSPSSRLGGAEGCSQFPHLPPPSCSEPLPLLPPEYHCSLYKSRQETPIYQAIHQAPLILPQLAPSGLLNDYNFKNCSPLWCVCGRSSTNFFGPSIFFGSKNFLVPI